MPNAPIINSAYIQLCGYIVKIIQLFFIWISKVLIHIILWIMSKFCFIQNVELFYQWKPKRHTGFSTIYKNSIHKTMNTDDSKFPRLAEVQWLMKKWKHLFQILAICCTYFALICLHVLKCMCYFCFVSISNNIWQTESQNEYWLLP